MEVSPYYLVQNFIHQHMKDAALHLRAFSKVKIPNQLDLTTNQTSEIETSNLSHHVKKITPPNPGAPKGIVLQANDSAQQPGAGLYDPTWSLHGGLKKGFHPRYFERRLSRRSTSSSKLWVFNRTSLAIGLATSHGFLQVIQDWNQPRKYS